MHHHSLGPAVACGVVGLWILLGAQIFEFPYRLQSPVVSIRRYAGTGLGDIVLIELTVAVIIDGITGGVEVQGATFNTTVLYNALNTACSICSLARAGSHTLCSRIQSLRRSPSQSVSSPSQMGHSPRGRLVNAQTS